MSSLTTLLLYPLLTTALYYLGSRAKITQFIWRRYPKWLDGYMVCSACVGTAYGVGVALVGGLYFHLPFLVLPGCHWITPVVVGLCSMVWTPVLAALHLLAMAAIQRVDEDNSPTDPKLELPLPAPKEDE